jgi:hypothetical protein
MLLMGYENVDARPLRNANKGDRICDSKKVMYKEKAVSIHRN